MLFGYNLFYLFVWRTWPYSIGQSRKNAIEINHFHNSWAVFISANSGRLFSSRAQVKLPAMIQHGNDNRVKSVLLDGTERQTRKLKIILFSFVWQRLMSPFSRRFLIKTLISRRFASILTMSFTDILLSSKINGQKLMAPNQMAKKNIFLPPSEKTVRLCFVPLNIF